MLKHKKLVSLVLALIVLAGFGGCGRAAQSGVTESGLSEESAPESSAASSVSSEVFSNNPLSTSSTKERPANTNTSEHDWFDDSRILNTAFTRKAIAAKPYTSTKSGMDAAKEWSTLFIQENYKDFEPYDITVKDNFYYGEPYFLYTVSGDKESFAIVNCTISFKTKVGLEGPFLSWTYLRLYFQVVMKSEGDQYTLLGFVTNQDRNIENSAELIDFLSGVPGYETTVFSSPEPPVPIDLNALGTDFTEKPVGASGLSVINLAAFVGDSYILDFHFFPGDLLAVLVCDPKVNHVINNMRIMVFAAEDMRLLYEIPIEDSNSGYLSIEKMNQETVLRLEIDDVDHYFTITQTGLSEFAPDRFNRYRLSDTAYIIEENNNLVLEQNGKKKILLEGIDPKDGEDATSSQKYFFDYRINDTRFIYEESGYESFNECGIYDIKTGKATTLTHKDAPCLFIDLYKNGIAILTPDEWSSYLSIGPYFYDESTGKITNLNWLEGTYSDGYSSSFVLVGNLLAVVIEDDPLDSFRVFDLNTKKEVLNIPFLKTQESYLESYSFYASENYFWFSSEYSNYYLFRFPIEEVIN